MSERRRWLTAALVIVWLAAVYLAYYYVHKPLRPAQALAVIQAAADLVTVGLLAAVAGGLGLRLLGDSRPASRSEAVAWSAGLGLGLMALAMLALGAVGGYRVWLLWLLLPLVVLLLRRDIRAWLGLVRGLWSNLWPAGRATRLWQGYVLVIFGLTLPLALLPPTAWDALVYHLTGPKLYLQAGRLVHPLDLPYLGFPQLGEMLFTAVLLLRRPAATQLVSLLYGGLLALGVYGMTARRWGRPAGTLAAAVLFSAIAIVRLLSWPYVDIMLMFYTLAAFAALTHWMKNGSRRWLLIAGLFAGMAMATKYTAVSIPMGAALVILTRKGWNGARQVGLRVSKQNKPLSDPFGRPYTPFPKAPCPLCLRGLLFFGLTAAAFIAPWLVKNWILTGNPIYPFFLPGVYWDSYRGWWYGRAGTGLAITAPWQIPLAPWFATIWGATGGAGFDATIGPLFLALVPLALITWRWQPAAERRFLGRAALFAAPVYTLWLVGISTSAQLTQTRLLFPIFPLLAILAAAGVSRLDRLNPRQLRLGWVARVLIAFVLLLSLVDLGLTAVRRSPLEVIVGFRPADDYLSDQLGWHQVVMEALNELPAGSRILFLWEPRSFYCPVECWPDALLDRWWHTRQTLGDPVAIAAEWRAAGVTHLLLFNSGYQLILTQEYDPISAADQAALNDLLAQEAILQQDFDGVYTLYQLQR